MSKLDLLKDDRVGCYSVILQVTVKEYLKMIDESFKNKGGIEGQRDTLKTSTAKRIRARMIEDLKKGAVLPPIVIGTIITNEQIQKLESCTEEEEEEFRTFIDHIPPSDIFIIDGMQRTTALVEATKHDSDLGKRKLRVEYWLASQINSITYRMLVLNTGQIPWNLRRQIEVIFKPVIKELMKQNENIKIIDIDDSGHRRFHSGEFHANDIIEMYMVFGSRKEKVDMQERLADEFTRQDFIESTSNPNFNKLFYDVINCLFEFDQVFGRYKSQEDVKDATKVYLKNGKDLFRSQPACIGFVAAFAITIMGRPGAEYSEYSDDEQKEKWEKINRNAQKLLKQLQQKSDEEIGEFLDFSILNELISKKTGKTGGYHQREFYLEAFKTLIKDNFEVPRMKECWRAY